MLCLLIFAQMAFAGEWATWTGTTQEGDTLTVEKKGRSNYKFNLEAPDKSDSIECSQEFLNMRTRTPLGLSIKTAGTRAKAGEQVGTVIMYNPGAGFAAAMPFSVCAIGLDAFPSMVVLNIGSTYKANGRTATLTPDQAVELGSWLVEVE